MTRREMGELAFKTLGVAGLLLFIIYNIERIVYFPPYVYGYVTQSGPISTGDMAIVTAQVFIPPCLGLLLIFGGGRLAGWLFGSADASSSSGTTSSRQLQAIAFSVLGLALLGFAVADLFSIIGSFYLKATDTATNRTPNWLVIGGPVIQALFGAWLFIGGDAMARFWHWLGGVGMPKADAEE